MTDGSMQLETPRLRLVLLSVDKLIARIEAMSPGDQAEVSPAWLAQLRAAPAADPWTHGFSMVRKEDGVTVGGCGYKGPPAADGSVEIAYAVDADYRGKGYATEAAEALVTFAFDSNQVRVVVAHTRPAEGPSTGVLTHCGFKYAGEVLDSEDGTVWRWERAK